MKLRLVTGLAAAGKSTWCYEDICTQLCNTNDVLFLVVPSYLVNEAEEAVLARIGGYERLKVLTLSQLAFWILRQVNIDSKVLGAIERQLLLQRVLFDAKESLAVLGKAASRLSFIQTVGDTISFIQQNGVSVDQFAAQIQECAEADSKLKDLAIVASEYVKRIGEKVDRESLLFRVLNLLCEEDTFGEDKIAWNQMQIWIDGYLWMSPLELEFVMRLVQKVKQVTITSLLTPTEIGMKGQREPGQKSQKFVDGLRQVAKHKGIPIEEIVTSRQRNLPAGLKQIAVNFLNRSAGLVPAGESVYISHYPDESTEVLWITARILTLVKDGKARWRDIVVIVGDMVSYSRELFHTFEQHRIPFSLRETTDFSHPLIMVLRQLVEIVDLQLQTDAVLEVVKSPLWPGAVAEKDKLEELVRSLGIEGEMWIGDLSWLSRVDVQSTENAEPEDFIDRLRIVLNPLRDFWHDVNKARTGGDFLRAFWNVISVLQLENSEHEQSYSQQDGQIYKKISVTKPNQYVWKQLIAVFDHLYEQFGDKQVDWDEFSLFWKSGLRQIKISDYSEPLNAVRIVPVSQAAGVFVPYVFVIGCVDGAFAHINDPGVLITLSELASLGSFPYSYPSLSAQKIRQEEQLGYIAFTRATKQLWVSWARTVGGRQAYPHAFVSSLRQLFSDVSVRGEDVLPCSLWADYELAAVSIAKYAEKRISPVSLEVIGTYNWLRTVPEGYCALARHLVPGNYSGISKSISRDAAKKLYKEPFVTSVSQLEEFSHCPFGHFLRYGLQIQPLREYKLEFVDYGVLIHAGLREFFRLRQISKKQLDRMALEEWADAILHRLTKRVKNDIFSLTSRHRYLYQRIRARLLDAMEILLEEEHRSQFRQIAAELEFGVGLNPGSVELILSDGTSAWLRGKIDRVDACVYNRTVWVRIWDYKLGRKGMDLTEVKEGLSLQLLAYMLVLIENGLNGKEVFPASVQYFSVPDVFLRSSCGPFADAEHRKKREASYKISGLFADNKDVLELIDCQMNQGSLYPIKISEKTGAIYKRCLDLVASSEEWRLILQFVRRKMTQLIDRILSGCVEMSPYRYGNVSACERCEYNNVCLFDIGGDYQYRVIAKLEKSVSTKSELLIAAQAVGSEKNG